MRHAFIFPLLALGICLSPLPAAAETAYVTDQLVLTLRSATGNQYTAVGHLKTATAVDILAEEGKFLKVRTEDGKEGYVLKQYITTELPKQQVVARQKAELEQLRARLQKLSSSSTRQQQGMADLEQQRTQLAHQLQQTRNELQQLTSEHQQLLDASQNLLQITQERDQLKEENQRLAADATRLQDENASLLTTGSIKWFLAGAGVLFFGWFMGKISRKKRRPF